MSSVLDPLLAALLGEYIIQLIHSGPLSILVMSNSWYNVGVISFIYQNWLRLHTALFKTSLSAFFSSVSSAFVMLPFAPRPPVGSLAATASSTADMLDLGVEALV